MQRQKVYLMLLISVMSFNFMGCSEEFPFKSFLEGLLTGRSHKELKQDLQDGFDQVEEDGKKFFEKTKKTIEKERNRIMKKLKEHVQKRD